MSSDQIAFMMGHRYENMPPFIDQVHPEDRDAFIADPAYLWRFNPEYREPVLARGRRRETIRMGPADLVAEGIIKL